MQIVIMELLVALQFFDVSPKGTLLHDLRGSTSRNCQGTLRNSTAVAVKNKKASVYVLLTLFEKSDSK